MRKFAFLIFIFITLISITRDILSPSNITYSNEEITNDVALATSANNVIFKATEIPDNIYSSMLGNSIPLKYKNEVDTNQLRFLQVSYYGFDNKTHVGEMIVNYKLSSEVLDIFRELYELQYPIEKICLIDEYAANDELSMSDNNTSCFCYRVINNTKTLSNHSTGSAIDINPLYNPYVSNGKTSPASANVYIDRNAGSEHFIRKNDVIYNIFIKYRLVLGWRLGKQKRLPTF